VSRLAWAVLALSLAAAPARAAGRALLWVPAETFSDWGALDAALRAGDARLTIGLSPALMTPAAVKTLSPWIAQGRVEAALRLDGDPILPLVASLPAAPRPQDVVDRLATARESYRRAFGGAPAGVVPGVGAVSAQILPAVRALSFSWIAAGDYAGSSGTWASANGLLVAPARAWPTTDGAVTVVDEADGLAPEGTALSLLAPSASLRPDATVSQAAAAAGATRPADPAAAWPCWAGSLDRWTQNERSKRAWALYAEAAAALDRYQNSGLANLRALDKATADLYGAQANRFYKDAAPEQAVALDQDFRSRLLTVYRRIHRPAPDALFAVASGEPAAGDDGVPTGVHVAQGPDWVEFDNPPASAARPPFDPAGADAGAGAPYTLKSLRVEVSTETDTVVLTYRLAALEPDAAPGRASAAPQLGRLLLETYIDINHVLGAGSTTLLYDRAAFIQARDAWEFALTVSAWGATLYRPGGDSEPIAVARPDVSADAKTGEVRVSIPRDALPGNPPRWGFVAASYEADPATAAHPPVRPVLPERGTGILSLIAPLEQQKALDAADARPRLAASRAAGPAAN